MCASLQDTASDEALASTSGMLTVLSVNIKDLPQAFCLLFWLTYALHHYPKCMANALKFIQTVMLGLGNKTLSPKLLTLKNILLG